MPTAARSVPRASRRETETYYSLLAAKQLAGGWRAVPPIRFSAVAAMRKTRSALWFANPEKKAGELLQPESLEARGQPTVARRRLPLRRRARGVLGGGSPLARHGYQEKAGQYPLTDFPVNIEILPWYPGDQISAVVSVSDSSKKSRKGYLAACSSSGMSRTAMRRQAAVASVRWSSSRCSVAPLHERAQGAHAARAQHARAAQSVRDRDLWVKTSHSWTRNDPRRIVSTVAAAVGERSHLAVELAAHLVGVTFPTCSSASAMHHVFVCPGWLRSWCAKTSVPCKDVSVLQLTLYDATGQSSNAMYFPSCDDGTPKATLRHVPPQPPSYHHPAANYRETTRPA